MRVRKIRRSFFLDLRIRAYYALVCPTSVTAQSIRSESLASHCSEGVFVETAHDDSFVVYVRPPPRRAELPQLPERRVFVCSSYEEARQICRGQRRKARYCVIRFIGDVGGGD